MKPDQEYVGLIRTLVLIGTMAMGCASPGVSSDPTKGVVLKIDFRASSQDPETLARLAGTVDVAADTMLRVSCYNVRNWSSDVTLNDIVYLSTDAGLSRAAELMASGKFDHELVAAVESEFWATGRLDYGPTLRKAGFTEEDVAAYLAERRHGVSDTAAQRFVVFTSAKSTRIQSAFYLDMDHLPWKDTSSGDQTHPVLFTTDGILKQVEIDDESCDHS